MLILSLCTALIVAMRCPETPTGRFIRHWLIEMPARTLAGLTLRKLAGWIAFFIALYAIAQALPMELALMGALDASAFVEITIAAGLVAADLRARGALKLMRIATRTLARPRTSQIRAVGRWGRAFGRAAVHARAKLKRPSASDEDGGAGLIFA
jgi:hypothetical protein